MHRIGLLICGPGLQAHESNPGPNDLVIGDIGIAPAAQRVLREVLGVPHLTPEEVEVALLEAELEQARSDRVIHYFSATSLSCAGGPGWHPPFWNYNMQWKAADGCKTVNGDTRVEAARAAVAHVHELRAEAEAAKKKLPEPEETDPIACCEELVKRGYICEVDCGEGGFSLPTLRWRKGSDWRIRFQECSEDPEEYHRFALRLARELAGE